MHRKKNGIRPPKFSCNEYDPITHKGYKTEYLGFKHSDQLDNEIDLGKKMHFKSSPTNPVLQKKSLICLMEGFDILNNNFAFYKCKNAIGVEVKTNRTDNKTLIILGDGNDLAIGLLNTINVFIIGKDIKHLFGGEKDDLFKFNSVELSQTIYNSRKQVSYIDGGKGSNTLDFSNLLNSKIVVTYNTLYENETELYNLENIQKYLGRKMIKDEIIPNCDTKYINTNGGYNFSLDIISIKKNVCYYNLEIIIYPYTNVFNYANEGVFNYFVKNFNNFNFQTLSTIELKSNENLTIHKIHFGYTIFELEKLEINNKDKQLMEILFHFNTQQQIKITTLLNLNISYLFDDTTQLNITNNTRYIIHNTNIQIDINYYLKLAKKLNTPIILNSLLKNKRVSISCSGQYSFLVNNPENESYLIGSTKENTYPIKRFFNKPQMPDVYIFNFVENHQSIDTIDLRDFNNSFIFLDINKDNTGFVITIRLNTTEYGKIYLVDAIRNQWYSNVIIYLLKRPIHIKRINDTKYILEPEPLIINLESSQTVSVISDDDIEFNNEIIITKNFSKKYLFTKLNQDLIITNAFSTFKEEDLFSLFFHNFYKFSARMMTAKIKFNDVKIFFKNSLNAIKNPYAYDLLSKLVQIERYEKLLNNNTI